LQNQAEVYENIRVYGTRYGVYVLFEEVNCLCKFVVAIPIVVLVNLSDEDIDRLTRGSRFIDKIV